ncbi:MAG: cytoskeletal protein CcmA (bactofilin family) [Glaciecola sp.]
MGDKGVINGDVKCKSAEIEGIFKGNLKVEEILSLKSSAQIYGDAEFSKLKVEEGAQLACSCNINKGGSNRKVEQKMAAKNQPIGQPA